MPGTSSSIPYDNGLLDYRNQPRSNGYFQDAPAKDKSDLVEYDFARSPTLNVPGDWNTQRPELLYYEGTVWYERKFDVPAPSVRDGRQFLQFGAAAQRAILWLNGRRMGEHEGGFTPFAFEVTGQLRARGNSLVVMVNNTRRPGAIPAANTDWWNYGGLTRGVRLIETPPVFIRAARVQSARSDPHRIAGFVTLDGARGPTPVTIEIPEANVRTTVTTDAAGRAAFDFAAAPALWSPEAPKLYDVTITAGGDRVRDQIGFRTIETAGTEIRLNGRSIFLRRHFASRGGARARWAGDLARRRGGVAGSGQGARLQLRSARSLPAQRGDDPRGRSAGPSRLVGDPGLLDDRLGAMPPHSPTPARSSARRSRATGTAPP